MLQAIAGRLRDPADLLVLLIVVALISAYFGLVFTASWRARLRADLAWAEDYPRKRLEFERQLTSPAGYEGWRGVMKPDGSWTILHPGADEGAA